jgi:hypothetical protein
MIEKETFIPNPFLFRANLIKILTPNRNLNYSKYFIGTVKVSYSSASIDGNSQSSSAYKLTAASMVAEH